MKLKKNSYSTELSDVEKRSEIEDVTVENMVTVEYKAIKSEKLRDENPKEGIYISIVNNGL